MYERIQLGPQKRPRDDSDVQFHLASSYRRAYPDDRQDPSRCAPYFDRLKLPEYYRPRAGSYRAGRKRHLDAARYFSMRHMAPRLALLPFGRKIGGWL